MTGKDLVWTSLKYVTVIEILSQQWSLDKKVFLLILYPTFFGHDLVIPFIKIKIYRYHQK